MRRGTLGDSDVSNNSLDDYVDNRTSRSIPVRNNRRKNVKEPSNTTSGASRRKNKTPKRKVRVLRDIIRLQKSTELLIPKLCFARLVREITLGINTEVTRYSFVALQALQEATEMYITQMLQDAYHLTLHRKRVTLTQGDIALLRFLKLQI